MGRAKNIIHQGIKSCYPQNTQTKNTPKPDNMDIKGNEKWGTPQEKEIEEKATKERNALQRKINTLDGKLRKDQKTYY